MYCSKLKNEIDTASKHKYGEKRSGDAWNEYLDEQAKGCAKLQLLSVSHKSSVKVNLSSESANSRGLLFKSYFFLLKIDFNYLFSEIDIGKRIYYYTEVYGE